MAKARKRGRPPKAAADKVSEPIFIRANPALLEAIRRYQSDQGLSNLSEAVRHLLVHSLREKQLME